MGAGNEFIGRERPIINTGNVKGLIEVKDLDIEPLVYLLTPVNYILIF